MYLKELIPYVGMTAKKAEARAYFTRIKHKYCHLFVVVHLRLERMTLKL